MRKIVRQRRGRQIRDGKAVSPVVATLILILVAVAAAAALYLWLVAWQGGVTKGIGSPNAQYTVTIGGSTSVYPFDQLAVTQFQQNNSNIVVSNNQGGSGAGMIAVCQGNVDIGATSSLQTPANLETNFGCPNGGPNVPVVTNVAYDGVDIIVASANTHGLISIAQDTLLTIYIQASTSAPTGGVATWVHTANGVAPVSATGLMWSQIPACSPVASGTSCAGTTEVTAITGAGGAACAGFPNDICGTTTPCGWSVCASGATPIKTVVRSDNSGTTQSFTARLLAIGSGNSVLTSVSALSNNFGGCGSDGQLGSCGLTATTSALGNPGVISAVAGSADSIGYASDGLTRVASSGVVCAGVATAACGIGFQGAGQTVAIQPSLGSSGTISSAIKTGITTTTGFVGWRPFQWVTLGTPTGEVQRLLQFVLDPANNFAFSTEANEISIYSV